ncbi:MAG: glutathione S-transferase family protein [Methylobacter sp.]|nr:glutathione S-transferase family protein [Methylobacter sp.]
MIKLYKFGSIDDVCDASPFCVKVEAYLRLAKLPYEALSGTHYLRKAPKGKLPYIEDNGKIIADSSFILEYLKETYGDTLDAELSDADKAIAHAFIKMIDENMYWILVHARWKLDHNSEALKKLFFGGIPFPLNKIVVFIMRKNVIKKLYAQGIGRHSDEEIVEIGNRDLKALADFLDGKPYFFGDQPTTLDAVAYGMLVQMIRMASFTAPIFDKAKSYKNLVEFTDRFHENYFSA